MVFDIIKKILAFLILGYVVMKHIQALKDEKEKYGMIVFHLEDLIKPLVYIGVFLGILFLF